MNYRSLEAISWHNGPINRRKKPDQTLDGKREQQNTVFSTPNKTMEQSPVTQVDNLADLYKLITSIDHEFNNDTVNCVTHYGHGNFMIIGEAPGKQEDIEKKPFVGLSGKLLRSIILKNHLDDSDLYITNVVNFRPPNNNTPDNITIDIFRPYLIKHVQLKQPKVILLCGSVALKGLMGNNANYKITKTRGSILHFENIPVIPTFHPAFILRNRNSVVSNQFEQDIKLAIDIFNK